MNTGQKVKDFFQIDLEELTDRATESDYWSNALKFYSRNEELPIEFLSEKEYQWLEKIEKDLGVIK